MRCIGCGSTAVSERPEHVITRRAERAGSTRVLPNGGLFLAGSSRREKLKSGCGLISGCDIEDSCILMHRPNKLEPER